MIGLDTNILLRAAMNDDAKHSPIARRIISELTPESPGHLSLAVVLEFAWSLRVRYKKPQDAIRASIEALLRNASINFGHRNLVSAAVLNTRLDFADAIIAADNHKAGCTFTLTFDEDALDDPHFRHAGA